MKMIIFGIIMALVVVEVVAFRVLVKRIIRFTTEEEL